jgi:hypothetical protein
VYGIEGRIAVMISAAVTCPALAGALSKRGLELTGFTMPPEIRDDLRAQAMAAIACWLERDKAGFDAVVGSDEEAAVQLPVVIGELASALEQLTSPHQLRRETVNWLNEHRARLVA